MKKNIVDSLISINKALKENQVIRLSEGKMILSVTQVVLFLESGVNQVFYEVDISTR